MRGAVLRKFDELACSVAREHAHMNSTVILSRVRVLRFESEEIGHSIVALQAAVANAKERRSGIEATLNGLSQVLEKRNEPCS